MKPRLIHVLLATTLLLACKPHPLDIDSSRPAFHVGYRNIQSVLPNSPFTGRLWYPISLTTAVDPVPTANIFHVYFGKKDAPMVSTPASLPLLVLSHGSGGAALRMDWMAHYFAERGWIVAGINHPGNTWDDNTADGLMQVWRRPILITRLLDELLKEPTIRARVDSHRIAAAGHSAGGAAVLLLAGAKLSKKQLTNPVPFCLPQPPEMDDERCGDLRKLDVSVYPKEVVERSYRDERIRAVIAMDPGFERSFLPLTADTVPARIQLSLAEKLLSPNGEIYAKDFEKILPDAETHIVPGSIHRSFITSCNNQGVRANVPICSGDTDRDAIQETVNRLAYQFLFNITF